MPWINKRWISFFVFAAVVGVVLISVAGWANNLEANKVKNQLSQFFFFFFFFFPHRDLQHSLRKDSFGTNPNGSFLDPDLGTNWTNSDEILVGLATVNSFDPNSKTGPSVSLTD